MPYLTALYIHTMLTSLHLQKVVHRMSAVQQPSGSRAGIYADLGQRSLREAHGTAITQHQLAKGPIATFWRLCIDNTTSS